ncbi:MAG: hypothetical protein ABSE57_04030 [Bryobacteraceae bacterium]|jgi:hypothetical protein
MTDEELDQRLRAAVLAEPVDTSSLERSIRERIRRPRVALWLAGIAASIAILIGAFFRPQAPPLCVAAAEDHRREIVEGETRPWLTKIAAIQSLAQKQGVPGSAIRALGTTGYGLERARLCFLKKQIFLHLVYTKDGEELSVYLRTRGSDSPFDGSVKHTFVGAEDLAYFETDSLTAVFVDERSKAQAAAFARAGARVL